MPPHSEAEIAKARNEARHILQSHIYGAVAYQDAETGLPAIGRLGVALLDGEFISLSSELSAHTKGMLKTPKCAIMLGEIKKGDGLASPRLSLNVTAEPLPIAQKDQRLPNYLERHPKAKLYAGFGDFRFFALKIDTAAYYGGFGRAHIFSGDDLCKKLN